MGHRNVCHLDVGLGLAHMIVTKDQTIDVLLVVAMIAKELFLTDVNELPDERRTRCRPHDTITEATHGLVAKDICECILFSHLVLDSLIFFDGEIEHIFFLCVDGAGDDIRAEFGDVLELVNG